jgi:hypothetical protein
VLDGRKTKRDVAGSLSSKFGPSPNGCIVAASSRWGLRIWGNLRRLCRFLAVLAFVGLSGCSASGPETALETAYSAVGGQVK